MSFGLFVLGIVVGWWVTYLVLKRDTSFCLTCIKKCISIAKFENKSHKSEIKRRNKFLVDLKKAIEES